MRLTASPVAWGPRWPGDLQGLANPGLYSWWVDGVGATDLTNGLDHPINAGRIYAGGPERPTGPQARPARQPFKAESLVNT